MGLEATGTGRQTSASDACTHEARSACWYLIALLVVVAWTGASDANAQLLPPRLVDEPTMWAAAQYRPQAAEDAHAPALRLRNTALIAGGALLVGAYGRNKWWQDGFTGSFRSTDEGWFGRDTSSGGADKLGHAMFGYTASRLLSRGFETLGNEPKQARALGFWSSVGLMTAVEFADGYSRQYRFSAQDFVMNMAGATLGYLMERYPAADRLLDFRVLYKPSPDSNFDPFGDYSGQTYLVVLKASGVSTLRAHEPARYLELALGYGTRGYQNAPGNQRSRNLYVGLSLNVSEILRQTLFRGSREPRAAQRGAELFFEFVQVPGTAALYRDRL